MSEWEIINMIEAINDFKGAYGLLSKHLGPNHPTLLHIQACINVLENAKAELEKL